MDSKRVKVLDNGDRVVVDGKKKQAAQCIANTSEVIHKAFLLRINDGSSLKKLGKRKIPEGCEGKCGVQLKKPSLTNYSNFMRSGLPQRVLFYQKGEWNDFSSDIVELVREEFKMKKPAIKVQLHGLHFMLDMLYMIQVDLKTASQKPIAWIDEAGGCFFPEVHTADVEMHGQYCSELEKDEEFVGEPNGTHEINLHLQIELNGVNNCGLKEGVVESTADAKRINIVQSSERNYLELGVNDDYYKKHVAKVEEVADNVQKVVANPPLQIEYVFETFDIDSVRKIFIEGMKPSLDVNILDINKCSTNLIQTRGGIFGLQLELTQKCRGNPNIRYAWLAATKDVLSNIMTYGLAHCGSKSNATYGLGVHLTHVKCAVASASYCDVDENGVRHMVLCRVILGNVELVPPGSTQFHPSSETFDNGVNDLKNPSHYIIWNMNMNTHIFPEFVVSFKMPYNDKVASLVAKEHNGIAEVPLSLDHPGKGQIGSSAVESGKAPSSGSSTAKTPNAPCMPFTMLFDAISSKVSEGKMNMLYIHYEDMKSQKLSRQLFLLKLRSIVGDEVLKTSILALQKKFPEKAKCVPESLIGRCSKSRC